MRYLNIFSINKKQSVSKTHNQVKQSVKHNPPPYIPGSPCGTTEKEAKEACKDPLFPSPCTWITPYCRAIDSEKDIPNAKKYCKGCLTSKITYSDDIMCKSNKDCCGSAVCSENGKCKESI